MAGNDHRSSTGVDRRASTRYSAQAQAHDDDDYDLEAMGISDGFRPMMDNNMNTSGPNHNRMSSQISQYPPGRRTPPPRPSSITKPTGIDSFALRHDGGMGSVQGRSSMTMSGAGGALTRSSSVSTDVPFMRAESPYQGPTGPSHPYQMYPQESRIARTASVATASTVAVTERPYNGPAGPTHPYGMYPQNTVDPELHESPPVPPIPVGFPGLNNNYQRRLGPEGEEIADMIGPDGHTEQLPPYTQYPDEAFARKSRPNVVAPIVGAGGIGLATRNPEFASQEDLHRPSSRTSSRTNVSSDAESNHNVNMAALGTVSEKPGLKIWQQVARRIVCGIVPIWALVLVGFVVVLFALILGTTLAILKPKHNLKNYSHPDDGGVAAQSVSTTTMTTTFDASPITSSPSNLPTLAIGTFALPISAPSVAPNSCLANTQQSQAWSCTIPMVQYDVAISNNPSITSDLDNKQIALTLNQTTFGGYYPYGTQPPVLNEPQQLNLVLDSQEPWRGPAWHFEMKFDKLVIIPETTISPASKRDLGGYDLVFRDSDRTTSDFSNRKNVAQPGDKPWFCYWNATLVEAFIYVNMSSSAASLSSASGSAATTSISSPSQTYASAAPSKTTSSSGSGTTSLPSFPPAYPKVIKLEERRVPGGYSPYCVQQIINADGTASPLMNVTNQPITIYLNETGASSISQLSNKRSSYEVRLEERDSFLLERQSSATCGCVWLWT